MKNKALTGILLVVVGFIWYKAFFRVKDSFFGEEIEVLSPERNQSLSFSNLSRDTFTINLNYRDPFGETKKSYSTTSSSSETEPNQRKPVPTLTRHPVQPSTSSWPEIMYYGQVRRTTSKNPLAIIGIDGYKHTIRKGEQLYDGIKVSAIGRDSVVVVYRKEKRVFWR